MTNTLKLNHENRTIVMDRTFAKYAEDTRSKEYAHLQQVRWDYPTYQVIQRHIKRKEDIRNLPKQRSKWLSWTRKSTSSMRVP